MRGDDGFEDDPDGERQSLPSKALAACIGLAIVILTVCGLWGLFIVLSEP